jgi:hypothetical protein
MTLLAAAPDPLLPEGREIAWGSILVVIGVLAFGLQIYAAVKAFRAGDNGWGTGIVVSMIVPFGFVLAIAYLMQRRSATSHG